MQDGEQYDLSGFTVDDLLKLDQQLCFVLYTASRLMTRAYRPLLEPLGLTYPQYLVLLVLWEADASPTPTLSVTALGQRLLLDSGTLTPLLKRMEGNGLLRRLRSEQDERQVEVGLTDQGRALKSRAFAIPLTMLCKSELPPGELLRLRDQLRRIIETIEV